MTTNEEKLTKEVQDLKVQVAKLENRLGFAHQRIKELSDLNKSAFDLLADHSESSDRLFDKYMGIMEKLPNIQKCSCANHECKNRKTYFIDNKGDISL